jgi:hypothetical protein
MIECDSCCKTSSDVPHFGQVYYVVKFDPKHEIAPAD